MAFNTVAEADAALGYLDRWAALDTEAKARALDTASLWLRVTYALPGLPFIASGEAIRAAELVAARVGLVTPLFPEPGRDAQGALIKLRKRVEGVVEREEQWAEPERPTTGPVTIAEVDAILGLVDIHARGDVALMPAAFVV